jgi:hypothetical protein
MYNDVYHDVTVTDNDKNTSFVSDFMHPEEGQVCEL